MKDNQRMPKLCIGQNMYVKREGLQRMIMICDVKDNQHMPKLYFGQIYVCKERRDAKNDHDL